MEFREEVIHREHFVTEPLKIAQPQPTQAATAKPVQLIYRHQTYTIEVPPGQFILKAALNNGIQLPYSCQGGLCSTCAGKCKQGKVKMMINEVLTDREVAEGWVLTCVAYPLSEDVIIEIPSV
jgi:ring-1,2-phenylacetyl-CoA epoxidase subunit PaaE